MEFEPLKYEPFLPLGIVLTFTIMSAVALFATVALWGSYFSKTESTKNRKQVPLWEVAFTVASLILVTLSITGIIDVENNRAKINSGFERNLSLKYDTENFRYEFPREKPENNTNNEIFKIRIITDNVVAEARASYDPKTGEPFLYDYIESTQSPTATNFTVESLKKD